MTAFNQLNQSIRQLEDEFESVRAKILQGRPRSVDLNRLHIIKEAIKMYADQVKAFDVAFDGLLANPEEMRLMELTKNHLFQNKGKTDLNKSVHPDLEILLEYFDQEMDQFTTRVTQLRQAIGNSEKLIGLRASIVRNKLIYINGFATIITFGTALGTSLAGIFTMNLRSYLEESYTAFVIVACVILAVQVVFGIFCLFILWKGVWAQRKAKLSAKRIKHC